MLHRAFRVALGSNAGMGWLGNLSGDLDDMHRSANLLHISNGDETRLSETGLPGIITYWRDVLHEGPVPAALSLSALSGVRARFVHDRGWEPDLVKAALDFRERDAALESFRQFDELVLWFEHDLYDQLQIIQILSWLAGREHGRTRISMICIGQFPGVTPFRGLGQLTPEQLGSLYPSRVTVSAEQFDLAARVWSAFTAPTPMALSDLLCSHTSALPFVGRALYRLLQQYPWQDDGLCRSERQILQSVADGPRTIGQSFSVCQDREEAPFLGDWCFATEYIEPMASGTNPLICAPGGKRLETGNRFLPGHRYWSRQLALSKLGRGVLDGVVTRCEVAPIDRWIGGVHLDGNERSWRWDEGQRRIVAE